MSALERSRRLGPRLNGPPMRSQVEAQLREANEHLVLATMKAQSATAVAIQAANQIASQAIAEKQLQEVQRLETLGTLAGGVAHDFNNLLTAIIGNAELGSLTVLAGGVADRHFNTIQQAAMRAAELTRQLLAYSGQGQLIMEPLDLGRVAREIILLLQVSIPRQVVVHCELEEHLPLVKGDATQLFQVIMNLTTNAGESFATDEVGQITIRTHGETYDEPTRGCEGWVLPLMAGHYAALEVIDTGHGMSKEIMARMFEPFYSTKFTGRGLGLAAVIGIVRSHAGGLHVESDPGKGTSFKVLLPVMA